MLLHSDGFDSHASNGTLSHGDPAWGAQSAVTVATGTGRFGGKALVGPAAGSAGYAELLVPGTNVAFAGWFRVTNGSGDTTLLQRGTARLLYRKADGTLVAGDAAGDKVTSPAGVLPTGTYRWIEVSYGPTEITLRVSGMPQGTANITSRPDFSQPVRVINGGSGQGQVAVDDLIVWDDQGSYMNTFGLSPRRIHLLRPTAPGASTGWQATGPNWQAADADNWNPGGAGVTAAAAGLKDLYEFGDLAAQAASVDALVVRTRVENTGDNPAQLLHTVRSAEGTEANGPLQAVPTTASTLKTAFYRDPNGAAWTTASINSLQAGQTSSN